MLGWPPQLWQSSCLRINTASQLPLSLPTPPHQPAREVAFLGNSADQEEKQRDKEAGLEQSENCRGQRGAVVTERAPQVVGKQPGQEFR